MIKKLFIYIRGILIINVPVRFVIKKYNNFWSKVFTQFTIHWPVYGTIHISLPNNKSVKIYSKGDDFVSTQGFWKGYDGYESPSIKTFFKLAEKSSVILDIGANVGYYSLIGAGANSNAVIYAFEPVPDIYQRLVKNVEINKFQHVKPFNAAVSNSETPLKFYASNVEGMAHAGSTKKGWFNNTTEIEVKAISIDNFKRKEGIKAIDLIKIDCEFHELEALAGMKDILISDKPVILMEVLFPEEEGVKNHFENDYYLEIEKTMKENGYYFYLINETALVRLDKLEYNPDDRNYLFSTKKSENTYLSFSDFDTLLKNIL